MGSVLVVSRISNTDLMNRHSSDFVVRTGFEPVQSDAVEYLPSRTPSALKGLRLPIPPPDCVPAYLIKRGFCLAFASCSAL